MKKLSLIVCRSDIDRVIRELTKLSCVEVEQRIPDEGEPLLRRAEQFDLSRAKLEKQRQETEKAISFLKKRGKSGGGLFAQKPVSGWEQLENEATLTEAMAAVEKTNRLIIDIKAAENEKAALLGKKNSFEPWRAYDLPLSFRETKETETLLGSFPPSADENAIRKTLEETSEAILFEKIWQDSTGLYAAFTFLRAEEADLIRTLNGTGFVRLDFSSVPGTGEENYQLAETALLENREKSASLEKEADELASSLSLIEKGYDILSTRLAEEEVKQKLLATDKVMLLEGFVPADEEDRLVEKLSEEPCCFELRQLEEGEDAPIKLKNNKFAAPFESVVSLYSLPAYGTYDPTFIMSIFYFLIFGMMLADVLYGAILSLGCLLLVKKTDFSDGVKKLATVLGISGLSSMLWGFLFGSWFGDMPGTVMSKLFGVEIGNIAPLFDPLAEPMIFLVFALGMGAVHLLAAMGVKFWLLWKEGKKADAIFDIGSWYLLFAGIGLYFVQPTVGLILGGAGALLIVCTAGREEKNIVMRFLKGLLGLYDIVSYASDLLSYSRIMALGLASAVIASVVNTIATLPGASPLGFVLAPIIILFGNIVNLGLNLLGTFVHTSRLQYLEFFGKFYVDGGRQFRPLTPQLTYTKLPKN